MSFLKPNGVTATLATLAVLAATCQHALADPTTLLCHLTTSADILQEDGTTTIELNEAQGTVVVNMAAAHYVGAGVSGGYRASSTGPQHAIFSNELITFSAGSINRLTGEFTNSSNNWKWACEAAKKRF